MKRPVPAVPGAKAALWEDFVDIFFEPSQVFARRDKFGLALVAISAVAGLLFLISQNALQPIFDAEFARSAKLALAKNSDLTAVQLAQGKALAERLQVAGYVLAFTSGIGFCGIGIWAFAHLIDSKPTFASGLMIATYAQAPRLLEHLVNTVQGWLLEPGQLTSRYSVSLGPARFANADAMNPVLLAVLGRFDLFTLWVAFLIAVGVRVTGRTATSEAFLVSGLVWLAAGIPAIISALRQ